MPILRYDLTQGGGEGKDCEIRTAATTTTNEVPCVSCYDISRTAYTLVRVKNFQISSFALIMFCRQKISSLQNVVLLR